LGTEYYFLSPFFCLKLSFNTSACITVQKNLTQERIDRIKESDALKRANFMKASHVPLFWQDAPVKPFRFNPKLDKEHQGQAQFVEIRAKFNSDRDAWEFIELCSRPSEPPQFLKLGKKDKAEALRMKQERFANSRSSVKSPITKDDA
jgi:hypothetical protein